MNYAPGKYGPGFNHFFYSHVFELLLRLRANYFWPAMWSNMFNVDDYENQPLADAYGIVMGSSHTEPFLRATNECEFRLPQDSRVASIIFDDNQILLRHMY